MTVSVTPAAALFLEDMLVHPRLAEPVQGIELEWRSFFTEIALKVVASVLEPRSTLV